MTRKQKRLSIILGGLAILAIAAGLVLYALRDSIVFFYTPSEVVEKNIGPGQRLRLGGIVEKESVKKGEGTKVSFVVTDTIKSIAVTFDGQLPDLFREGQGVVAEGVTQPDGSFLADTVLAKHEEKYMPKDLADKLKEKGVWQETGAPAAAGSTPSTTP